jgi:hypothetical protein
VLEEIICEAKELQNKLSCDNNLGYDKEATLKQYEPKYASSTERTNIESKTVGGGNDCGSIILKDDNSGPPSKRMPRKSLF